MVLQTKIEKLLPKMPLWFPSTPVSVCRQWIKCGRSNCRCVDGGREHRHPAYYAFWRESGRLRKHYLTNELAHVVREYTNKRRARLRKEYEHTKTTLNQCRDLRKCLRLIESSLNEQKLNGEARADLVSKETK